MFLNICEQSNFLSVIVFIKTIINLIQIIVPIALIIMCSIDLAKQVINPDEKTAPNVVKRGIVAVTVFFIPAILNILLEAAGQTKFTATTCWTNANASTIAYLKEKEKLEEEALRKAEEEARKEKEKQKEEEQEAEEAIEEMPEEDVEETTFLKENGTDGKVTVVDGVFYKPSGQQPSDDSARGSGPYGYNIYFYERLEKMVADAKEAGYTIRYSTSADGAYRAFSRQAYFYCCYTNESSYPSYCNAPCNNGNLAAVPGYSNHGWGIASDMSWGSTEAKYWAHDNAYKYGLAFPLCNNVRNSNNCEEHWHIEPSSVKRK